VAKAPRYRSVKRFMQNHTGSSAGPAESPRVTGHRPCLVTRTRGEPGCAAPVPPPQHYSFCCRFTAEAHSTQHLQGAPAIFKLYLEDSMLLLHPAPGCNKPCKAPSGPGIGYSWRPAMISEEKQNQSDRHEIEAWMISKISYHSPTDGNDRYP